MFTAVLTVRKPTADSFLKTGAGKQCIPCSILLSIFSHTLLFLVAGGWSLLKHHLYTALHHIGKNLFHLVLGCHHRCQTVIFRIILRDLHTDPVRDLLPHLF